LGKKIERRYLQGPFFRRPANDEKANGPPP